MNDSPASIIYNSDGYEVSIKNREPVRLSSALLVAGSDGYNYNYLLVNSSGQIEISNFPLIQNISDGGGSITIDTSQLPSTLVGGRLDTNIGSWFGSTTPTVGQKTTANSIPVTMASDQGAIAISSASIGVNGAMAPSSSTQIGGYDGYSTTLEAGRVFDLDSGAGTEYNFGVSLRKSKAGGSVPLGTEADPLIISPDYYGSTLFGEMRVATPYTLIDIVNKYNLDPTVFETSTATGGVVAHVPTHSSISLSVTGTSGSAAKLRTNNFFRYQAGKQQVVKLTVTHADTGKTNQTRNWGYFSDEDGLFFQLSGTALNIVRRTSTSGSPVDNITPQSSWNIDRFDGTGSSGVNLNVVNGNIYEIHFQWLGVGIVQFFINGTLVHQMNFPNTLPTVYMKSATLPVSWEIINTGTSTASSMEAICASVISEGGAKPPEFSYSAYNATPVVVGGTEIPILSIRPKQQFNSINNRMLIHPFLAQVSTEGSRAGYRIILNPTLTGASWVSADTQSGVEYDVSSTTFSGGYTLFRGFLPNTNDSQIINLDPFFDVLARVLRNSAFSLTPDILTITAINEAAGNTNIRSSVAWHEIR